MQKERELFDFRRTEIAPTLIILDRRNDPVTPFLMQWTYQGMVHEIFTITNHRVDLSTVSGINKDLKEIVLSAEQDIFFKDNMYQNFGEIGVNIKALVDQYAQKTKTNQNIQSIADMKKFVETYPEFKKLSGNVSKHVALVSEISRVVESRNLLQVSEVQQELACHQDHAGACKAVKDLLNEPNISNDDKLKLVLLYALRYENDSSNKVSEMIDLLHNAGLSQDQLSIIGTLIAFAGESSRAGDLFSNRSIFRLIKRAVDRGLRGVPNIFTQHKPLLDQILEQLLKNRLPENEYPFLAGVPTKAAPQDVIVFIVGGATFEETVTVANINNSKEYPGQRVVLGSTFIHNSISFLEDIAKLPPQNSKRRF